MFTSDLQRRSFSLIELVIVVMIMGTLAAIAIPRISRGAAGAATSAVRSDLRSLRQAIEMYAAEHDGSYPTQASFRGQMTQYTDTSGEPQASRDATHRYGPYLVEMPVLKVGEGPNNGKGRNGVDDDANDTDGWVYDENLGIIKPNSGTATDEDGKLLSDY